MITNTETFITQARNIHGLKYDYSLVEYTKSCNKVQIICSEHGMFEQRANNHISHKQGCPLCDNDRKRKRAASMVLLKSTFVKRAKTLYGSQYSYKNMRYVRGSSPITITCKDHGDFTVKRAEKHLMGQGCPSCSTRGSFGERLIVKTLTDLGVIFIRQHTFDQCRSGVTNRKLPYDFFIPNKNVLIEFDGDQHHKQSPLFHKGDRFLRMKAHDQIKTEYAANNNITLVRFSKRDIPHLLTKIKTLVI